VSRNDVVRAISLVAVLTLGACSDAPSTAAPQARGIGDGVPPEVAHLTTTTCQVTRIFQIATQLSPFRVPNLDLKDRITIILLMKDNRLADAQRLTLALAELLGRPAVIDRLRDPNGALPPTKAEAISELVNLMFECVQLPPPGDISGAYGPGGGIAVVSPEGGTVVSNDEVIGVQISDEATSVARLIALVKISTTEEQECLPGSGLRQVVDCYQLSSTPDIPFDAKVRLVMCSFDDHDVEGHDHVKHDRLRIAKTEHNNDEAWKVYDQLSDPIGLDCEGKAQQASYENGIMGKLHWFADALTQPFRPKLAYAADGVGADIDAFSRATVVDPITFGTGFEDGEPEFATGESFWHRSTLSGIVNGIAVGEGSLVDLAAGDESGGALPGALGGTKSLWYGEDATGNYRGAPWAGGGSPLLQVGGRSNAANSGTASSPFFAVPNTLNSTSLSFKSWFEIESVNPGPVTIDDLTFDPFDIMDVTVDVQGGASGVLVKRMNPDENPGGAPRTPFTSGGFNAPPTTSTFVVDLSAYRGQTIRLNFTFNTVDILYNGFRGWIVDDVAVVIGSETTAAPPILGAPLVARMTAPSAPRATLQRVQQ
jgi:hypothetical protein